MTSDFNYKKYSLENLENWMYDSMSSAEATPQEIYDVIKGVVEENYYTYKHQASQAYELLALLNGNGKGHITNYPEEYKGSTVSSCDKDDTTTERKGVWNSFWEENYYPEEYKTHTEMVEAGYEMTADGFWVPPQKEDKVVKWLLPVETDPNGEYFIQFPDDLLDTTGWKENDTLNWKDNGDGTFTLTKHTEPLGPDEC